ncbi:MAG: MCE family protein [Chitinispirillaceae bacterium]|nr:MCE family protein [Chitinispirillaceae bacterium]
MKKTNTDLIVGATILVALFILIAGVLWLKEALVAQKMVSYTFLFPNVGTLQVGDPVMANGVTKGRVTAIRLRGEKVATVIDLEKEIVITDSARVVVQNIGLMGERGVGVLLTKNGLPFRPSKKKDTTFIEGYFDTGIAEAMGMMGTVLAEVKGILDNFYSLMGSAVGDTDVFRPFRMLVKRLDTLSAVAEKLVVGNAPLITASVKNLNSASVQLKSLLDRNGGNMESILKNGQALSAYSLVLASRVDSLTASIQSVVKGIQNSQGALGMLISDREFSRDLRRTVASVDSLVSEVRSDALKLRVKLGFGSKKR